MQTLFYFDDLNQLNDYESFEVKAVPKSHSEVAQPGEAPKFWSVIGTLKEEKVQGLPCRQFPVADFPTELYAGLFADLCKQVTTKA